MSSLDEADRRDKRIRQQAERWDREARCGTGANGAGHDQGFVLIEHLGSHNPERLSWIWHHWLVAGKLQILAGAPGTGKTSLAIWMAAIVSSGARWLDQAIDIPARDVVIWSGEDTIDDVILPRLMASGADCDRVFVPHAVIQDDARRAFDPAEDLAGLAAVVKGRDIGLIILDPLISAISGDAHKSVDVRRGLQAVADLAAATGAAVLGISHFTKGTSGRDPLERVTGSLAFGAFCRVVMAAAKDQTDDAKRVFCRVKSNCGPDTGGWQYSMEPCVIGDGVETVRVRWGDPIQGTARDILGAADAADDEEERGALQEAREFIRSMLADGRIPSRQFLRDAQDAGHSVRTMRRAMRDLTESRKEGKTWYVSLA